MAFSEFIGNPASWIGDMVRRGLSQNKAEDEARLSPDSGGMGFRGSHQSFRSTFKSVRDTMAAHPDVSSIPYDSPAPDALYKPWQAGGSGAYVHQVTVHMFDPGIGGTINQQWTIRSDVPLSPAEAAQRAQDEAEEGALEGSGGANQRAMGATLTGLHYATRAT